jgi:hypothetical protein
MKTCYICKRELGTAPDTQDCGGDCLRCLAEVGDPDALEVMRQYEPGNAKWAKPDGDEA